MIGFFLPCDSLLFIAGLLTLSGNGTQHLSLPLLLAEVPVCAVAGAQLVHYFGARFGRPLFNRPDSRLFKREYVDKAEEIFVKYGPAKATILAGFIPIVRTFVHEPGPRGLEDAGPGVLRLQPHRRRALERRSAAARPLRQQRDQRGQGIPSTLVIVLLSLLPILWEYLKARRSGRQAADGPADAIDDSTGTNSDFRR